MVLKSSQPNQEENCVRMGMSLHGLWHLIVYIWARHCIQSDCIHMGMSLHGLWHLIVYIRACHIWAVTSDCVHMGMSLHELWHQIVYTRAHYCMDIMMARAIIILHIWFVNRFCRCRHLNDQIVLFLTIQFNISQQS